MKIKNGYLLREVAENHVVVPVGNLDFDGMITLNETGTLIWKKLEIGATEEELIQAILAEYDVSKEIAAADVKTFLQALRGAKLLDE